MTFAFTAYVELLQHFLTQRAGIIANLERQLNCHQQNLDYQQDLGLQERLLQDAFFSLPSLSPVQRLLRDQLELAHWASGFKPRANPGNDIIHPVPLAVRTFHLWQKTHWPGQKGRARCAQMLFNVAMLRSLALLTLRLWDDDSAGAAQRLAQLQTLLDQLWRTTPAGLPVLVRNVCWLLPVAMSPTTDDLRGYFDIAACIDTLPATERVEIHLAGVQTGAGHLRSQLRHLAVQQGVTVNAANIVLTTRVSNALDVALLMQGLVTLLQAYADAVQSNAAAQRQMLAAAICQGLSPDPELFVNRVDLLAPYTMIEHLFISSSADGAAHYTTVGERHLRLLQDYQRLLAQWAPSLLADSAHSAAPADGYSPYGVLYGFSSNLIELQAFKSLQLDAETRYSIEDVFSNGAADKVAWVNGWRHLPHVRPEVVQQFEYPAQFAQEMHTRVRQALAQRVATADANVPANKGQLYVLREDDEQAAAQYAHIATLAARFIHTSDPLLVATGYAVAKDQADLLYCRLEGEYLVSYQTTGGWVGISKDLLTEVVGAGEDAKLSLPKLAAAALRLMGLGFVQG